MNIAILALGSIAHTMAKTINLLNQQNSEIKLYACGSRNLKKAQDFAKTYNIEKYYDSYQSMLMDDNIDLVYIASPHSHHYEHAKLCLAHNKNMLIEKAFFTNAKQAGEIIKLARDKNVFIAEAIWTRYMPSFKIIKDIIHSGVIGSIKTLEANLSYPISDKHRIVSPDLAGGALLDLGVYVINFAMMFNDDKEVFVDGFCHKFYTGVDSVDHITMKFSNGVYANLTASALNASDRLGYIYGENGYIKVTNINNPELIECFDNNHHKFATHHIPKQLTGYEYQILECLDCIKKHRFEPYSMPHEKSIKIMEIMDKLREKFKVRFTCE